MLDVSKEFEKISYCTLFNKLLDRDISPLLISMYINSVQWCQTSCNGVKQCGGLSTIIFVVYVDSLHG